MSGLRRSCTVILASLHVVACGTAERRGELPLLTAERELTIGSIDDSEQALTSVGTVSVDDAGTIYLTQPQDKLIRVFSSTGEFVRTIGRGGQGPGEFETLGFLGWLADTLYVSDRRNQRVSFFLADGTFIRSLRLSSPLIDGVFSPTVPNRMLGDGTALVQPSFPSRLILEGKVEARPLYRIDREGAVLGKVAETSVQNSQLSIERENGSLFAFQPFSDAPLLGMPPSAEYVVVLDRYAATSETGTMGVHKITLDGDTLFSREILYDPLPLRPSIADSVIGALAENFSGVPMFGSARAARDALEDLIYVPAFYPPTSRISVGSDGRVWVRREVVGTEPTRWDVLSPEGQAIGRLVLPSTIAIHESRGDLFWATERDALDVTYVVRYRIAGG